MEITNKIRLIELFGGIGSQAMSLRDIGANFEHYRLVEFDKHAVASYNAIHGTNFETMDIRNVHGADLGIVDRETFTYIMTYSFPCTDLSIAGKMKGMSKTEWEQGNSTHSGLLWEVERILKELKADELPQVLLMENVTQVHAQKNKADFEAWLAFLQSRGYFNFYQDLNAKNYGIPQNRNRCFCVSILSPEFIDYEFPEPVKLEKVMRDYLEEYVDEKYYIKSEKADKLITDLIECGELPTEQTCKGVQSEITVKTKCVDGTKIVAKDYFIYDDYNSNVPQEQKSIGTITQTCGSSALRNGKKIIEKLSKCLGTKQVTVETIYRIRKLTPRECWRLMGYTDTDFDKAAAVNSNTQLYKQSGNAIVKQVLMAIFSSMNINNKVGGSEINC